MKIIGHSTWWLLLESKVRGTKSLQSKIGIPFQGITWRNLGFKI